MTLEYNNTPSQGYIHKIIQVIFQKMNINNINIAINDCNPNIASVIGINFYDFLGWPSYINISLDFSRIKDYDNKELLFIISHECAHVYYNHILPNIFWFIAENLIRGKNNENGALFDLARLCSAFLNKFTTGEFVPIDKAYIKRIESEADEFAVNHITHDIDSAIRCLKHLCNNNLQRESHIWEISQISAPIMTMDERIRELKKRVISMSLN